MSHDEMLKAAVLAWQKKYRVNDNDPLLATVELFQIHFANWQGQNQSDHSGSAYDEFRASFEELSGQTKALSKQTSGLIEALRNMPDLTGQLRSYRLSTLWMAAGLAFGAGIGIGKFLPL